MWFVVYIIFIIRIEDLFEFSWSFFVVVLGEGRFLCFLWVIVRVFVLMVLLGFGFCFGLGCVYVF